jgi:glycosyltransferase involved in cell wall biosynthesis
MDYLVTAIIPFYNDARLAAKAATSVLAQTHSHLEVLLIDDGSTTDIAPVLELAEVDQRVRVISKANGGVASARNLGLDHAEGDFVAFLDADDIWNRRKLAQQIIHIVGLGADASHTSYYLYYPSRKLGPIYIPSGTYAARFPHIISNCPISMSTMMMRKELFLDGWRFSTAKLDSHTVDFAKLVQSVFFAGLDQPLSSVYCRDLSVAVNLRSKHEALRIHLGMFRNDPQLSKHEYHISVLNNYARHLEETALTTGSDFDEKNIRAIFGGSRRSLRTIIHMLKTNTYRIMKSKVRNAKAHLNLKWRPSK